MTGTSTTGSTGQDKATRDYVAELSFHLVRTGLDGSRVGEILAEVEAHVAATGEPARVAFGRPREYARRWAPDVPPEVRRRRRLRRLAVLTVIAAVGGVIGWLVAQVPMSSDLASAGLLMAVVSALALVGLALPRRGERVIDPRTGRMWPGTRSSLLGACAILGVLLVTGVVLATVF